jgi:hypothetical protein
MKSGLKWLGAGISAGLLAGAAAAQTPAVPATVPGCARVGPLLSAAELLEIVPGNIHTSDLPAGGEFVERYSLLDGPAANGLAESLHPEFGVWRARYRIGPEGLCLLYDGIMDWECQRIARCASGEVGLVAWFDGGEGWAIGRIERDPEARLADLPVLSVSPRPVYDASGIAPAANWAPGENEHFGGFAGLVGVYVAEGAGTGPVIEEYFTAQDYSTGQRASDDRRIVSSLLRLHRSGQEPVQLYHFASESGTREAMLGLSGAPEDRLDLATASPGVVDLVTDAGGEASPAHWTGLVTRLFWTYAQWDPASHVRPAQLRVISPFRELLGRSVLLCDSAEMGEGAPQVSLLGAGETCRRYDRAHEVTELLRGRNALQVAAALGAQGAPLVMQVGEIAVAGDTITLGAVPVAPFVLINTGQFQGWADWMDRTQSVGGRERPVTCRFPLAVADRLGATEAGDLLRFRAELAAASDAGVQLDCRLE